MKNRRSIRLKDYDYSQEGAYFVTMCTQGHKCLFGYIAEGEMRLNDAGKMIQEIWKEIPQYYMNMDIDYFQIMPNHIHGVIIIRRGLIHQTQEPMYQTQEPIHQIQENREIKKGVTNHVRTNYAQMIFSKYGLMNEEGISLGKIIRYFKAKSTRLIHKNGYEEFSWQRNYYEHIIRDDKDLHRIREYIINNPVKWQEDKYYIKDGEKHE